MAVFCSTGGFFIRGLRRQGCLLREARSRPERRLDRLPCQASSASILINVFPSVNCKCSADEYEGLKNEANAVETSTHAHKNERRPNALHKSGWDAGRMNSGIVPLH